MLKASAVGAVVDVNCIPLSRAMQDTVSEEHALGYALTGGEDYELLFTVPEAQKGALETALSHAGAKFVRVGQICAGSKLKLQLNGEPFTPPYHGFEHF